MNAMRDDTFAGLVGRLCELDDTTAGQPQVADADRQRALAGLEWLLLAREALRQHVRVLQKRFDRSFRHHEPLPDEQADQITQQGPGGLSNDELARLLLNPIALSDLAIRIKEDLPDYWLDRLTVIGREMMQAEGISSKKQRTGDSSNILKTDTGRSGEVASAGTDGSTLEALSQPNQQAGG